MPPTTLILIRHADAKNCGHGPVPRLCGWYDPPLSDLGRAQAECLHSHLTGNPAAALYASTLRRARDTAEALRAGVGVPVRVADVLREIRCGAVDGMPIAEVTQLYPELWARNLAQLDEDFSWPGGESYREFRSRALQSIECIAAAHPGERVLVVTHAGVISQILGALEGVSAARWDIFRPGSASITELRWEQSRKSVVRFDDRTHLAARER